MTRSYSFAVAIAAILGFTAHLQAEEIKPKQTDPTPTTEKVARADDSMEKMDKATEKDAPVSLIKASTTTS